MALQKKQQQLAEASEFFQPAKNVVAMDAEFVAQLEHKLGQKYITYYANQMTQKPFWQQTPFIGGLTVVAVAAMFIAAGAYLQINSNRLSPSNQLDDNTNVASTLGAELAYLEGDVEYRSGTTGWMMASTGMDLKQGDAVRTFADARAIINLDDGSAIRLNYDSEVELSSLDPQDMKITNLDGEVYARVAKLDRSFAVVTEELDYVSLGTAYTTINKKDEKGVKVFHSQVKVDDKLSNKEVIVDEGKTYFHKQGEIKDLTLGEIKKDEFALWNKDQDEQKSEYQAQLGKLSDLTAPELKITSHKSGKTVSNAKITIKGTAEIGAVVKVKGTEVENDNGNFQKQVSLKKGKNAIDVSAIDAAGNKTTKTLNITYKQSESTSVSTGGSGTIVITSVTKQSNGVKVQWSINGISAPEGFKVVYGTGANPVYGQQSAQYQGSGDRSAFISIADGKTYHFRVCRYTGSGCDNYSNDVTGTAPAANPVTSISDLIFDAGNNKLKWNYTGGPAHGFKVLVNGAITYYTTNNYYVLPSAPAGETFKVCAYDGSSGCTAVYSNVITP